MIHVYRVDRPGQRRGVSWFAPITIDLHDFDGYEDAVLLRAKMAACKVDYVIAPESITQAGRFRISKSRARLRSFPYGTEVKSTPAPDSGDYVPFAKQRLRQDCRRPWPELRSTDRRPVRDQLQFRSHGLAGNAAHHRALPLARPHPAVLRRDRGMVVRARGSGRNRRARDDLAMDAAAARGC